MANTNAMRVDISKIHAVSRLLKEIVNYPGHVKRASSPEYTKAHKYLVKEKDLPCLACGVKNSTLDDPKQNPYGAKQLETHHHNIEWALANAIDLKKFNARVVAHMRARPYHDPIYDKAFTQDQLLDWVDHHLDNLWVICDVHHRGAFFGIHEITFPIWGPQDLIRDDFVYIPGKDGALGKTAKDALAFKPPSAKKDAAKKKAAAKKPSAKKATAKKSAVKKATKKPGAKA